MQINTPRSLKPAQLFSKTIATVGTVGLGLSAGLSSVTAQVVQKTVDHSTTETPAKVTTCYLRREIGSGAKVLADAVEQFAVNPSRLEQSLAEAEKGCKEAMLDRQKTRAFVTIPSAPVNTPPVVNFKNPSVGVQQYLTIAPTWLQPTAKKPKTILPQHLFAYINLQKETTPVVEGYQLKNNEAAVVCYTESSGAKQLDIEGNLVPRKVLRITPEMATLPETQLAKVAPLDKLLQDCYKAAPLGAVVLGTTVAVPAVIPTLVNPNTYNDNEIKLLSKNYQNTKTTLPHRKNP